MSFLEHDTMLNYANQHSIREHRPRLCVSAYHRPTDLLDLTEYVMSLRPDSKVDLRHHTTLRWDTCLYFH